METVEKKYFADTLPIIVDVKAEFNINIKLKIFLFDYLSETESQPVNYVYHWVEYIFTRQFK